MNIGVWSVIIQFINIIFYLGYAASAYSRSVCNKFLAEKNYESFKTHLKITSFYLFFTLLSLNINLFISAPYLASLFFTDDDSRLLLSDCLKLLSMFFYFEGLVIYLTSALRMIGFETFCFRSTFIAYICIFPPLLIFLTLTFKTGVFVAMLVLYSFTGIINLVYTIKLVNNFKDNVQSTIDRIEEENSKLIIMNEENNC
jgi:Na+-driven multidrug efflux pump